MQFNIFLASLLFTCSAVFAAADYDALTKDTTAFFVNNFKSLVHKQAQDAVNLLTNLSPPEAQDDVRAFLNTSFSALESQIVTDVTPIATKDIANAVKALEIQQKTGFGPLEYAQLAIKLYQDVPPAIDREISKWIVDNTDKLIEVARAKTGSALDDLIKKLEDIKKKVSGEQNQASTNSVKLHRRSFIAIGAILGGILKVIFGYVAVTFLSCLVTGALMAAATKNLY